MQAFGDSACLGDFACPGDLAVLSGLACLGNLVVLSGLVCLGVLAYLDDLACQRHREDTCHEVSKAQVYAYAFPDRV